MSERQRLPDWIKKRLPTGPEAAQTRRLINRLALATVCSSAKCPNIWECYGRKVATFMILGDTCTRACAFCGVNKGTVGPLDPDEPHRVAQAVSELGLRHAVITSVTRDDLRDGGAAHFAATVAAVRALNSGVTIEVLTPDFLGSRDAIRTVLETHPDVFNHNVETVPRLYPDVRPQAVYARSLDVLRTAKQLQPAVLTKSGLMVGLGETCTEIEAVLADLRAVGVDVITIGQYLQPSKHHLPVAEFIEPAAFSELEAHALRLGFTAAFCGPFVRSSYHAGEILARTGRASGVEVPKKGTT
ncbi:MAG: lipoyl synthase [Verrucomicrobia bacterium]|nr:lipoyl synthase [Verrucomicrobiota bacterium]